MDNKIKILSEKILLFINQGLSYEENRKYLEEELEKLINRSAESGKVDRPDGRRDIEMAFESNVTGTLCFSDPYIGEDSNKREFDNSEKIGEI